MREHFLTLSFRLPKHQEESLPELLTPWPVLGCEVLEVNAEVEVTVFLQNQARALLPQLKGALKSFGALDLAEGTQPDLDWIGEYRQLARPFRVGHRFWIDPHPDTPTPPPAGCIHLLIEPRQAFGTGSHESTQLMLLLLEDRPPVGARVLDVGTGSGVLALAARALGARWVLGFDVDADAVFVACETAHLHPQWPVALFAGPSRALAPRPAFDLILANMLVEQFVPLLPRLRRLVHPGGTLFLSGLLVSQKEAVAGELAASGFALVGEKQLGEWAAVVASPR
ncbi:Ribosomal protein L11 methyltransferase [bacterium HR09]|nr:Ribosomal protein L11 methyltransferase [bacterium HR09]